jgi:hypothetical protein
VLERTDGAILGTLLQRCREVEAEFGMARRAMGAWVVLALLVVLAGPLAVLLAQGGSWLPSWGGPVGWGSAGRFWQTLQTSIAARPALWLAFAGPALVMLLAIGALARRHAVP